MNILGAHIDSPRLDVKQNPLYEDNGFTYLDTHYYGGIKKWQWVTLPLAIHGVVAKKNGEVVDVVIGEDDNDPVFCVTDLLIHLSREQQTKPANTVVEGENLDLLIGSQPLEGTEKEAVKAMTLKLLNDKYGIEEEDFLSAELEIVPAGKARELGMCIHFSCRNARGGSTGEDILLPARGQGGDRKRRSNRHAVSFLRKHHGRAACTCRRGNRTGPSKMPCFLQNALF